MAEYIIRHLCCYRFWASTCRPSPSKRAVVGGMSMPGAVLGAFFIGNLEFALLAASPNVHVFMALRFVLGIGLRAHHGARAGCHPRPRCCTCLCSTTACPSRPSGTTAGFYKEVVAVLHDIEQKSSVF